MDTKFVLEGLDIMVENPVCELNYKTPFELLIAVILSAQCTDKRVNQVTSELFKTHNNPEDFVSKFAFRLWEKPIKSLLNFYIIHLFLKLIS